jgi:Bacterial Ig-like domain (group 1)
MTIFTASFWWVWAPIAFLCLAGIVNTNKASKWFPVFWLPLVVLCLIGITVFLKSCGAGPKDGPSGLVILFAVFPTLIASSLGFVGAAVLFRNKPTPEAWSLQSLLGGLALSGVAIGLTIHNVAKPLEVTVVNGSGKPVPNITVELTISDHMGQKSQSSDHTDANGVAHLSVWPNKYLELKVKNTGGYDSRVVLGLSGWGVDQNVWQHSWGKSSRSYFGLGCGFLDDDPYGKKLTIYLRNEGELFLPAVAARLAASFKQIESHPLSGHLLSSMGRTFEIFGHTEELGRTAGGSSSLSRAAVQALVYQAEILDRLRDDHPKDFQTLVIGGASSEELINKLLDAAKPMLGRDDTTAGVYRELRSLAKPRLNDLIDAEASATPRGRQMIRDAIGFIDPPSK